VDSDSLTTYANSSQPQPRLIRWQTTAVGSRENDLPTTFSFSQNYPNPFNPATIIEFALPKSTCVSIRIFDVVGSEIRMVLDETLGSGYHKARWDGKDAAGNAVPSGVYFFKMQAGDFVAVRKAVLIQ
jgi:hypothetical protein